VGEGLGPSSSRAQLADHVFGGNGVTRAGETDPPSKLAIHVFLGPRLLELGRMRLALLGLRRFADEPCGGATTLSRARELFRLERHSR
jgi:hypothetical protein